MKYRDTITIEPGKVGGKPCIRRLRITVYDILHYLASGMSEAEILADFPDLQPDDSRPALAFAADRETAMPTRSSKKTFGTVHERHSKSEDFLSLFRYRCFARSTDWLCPQ